MSGNDDVHDLARTDSVMSKRRKLKRSASSAFGAAAAAAALPARVPRGVGLSAAAVSKMVKRIVNEEHEEKWYNSGVQGSASTAITLVNLTAGIVNGTEHYNRDGSKIKITNIRYSGRTDCADVTNVVRFGFFTWDGPSDDPPNGAAIDTYDSSLWTTGYISTYALVQDKVVKGETGRYDRIKWVNGPFTYAMQTAAQANIADYTVSSTEPPRKFFAGKFPVNRVATFNTTDVCVGTNVYLAYWSDSSVIAHPPFYMDIRVYFKDV